MRRVEGEGAWLDLADREVALGACEPLREEAFRTFPIGVRDQREALAQTQRGLNGVRKPRALRLGLRFAPDHESVDDHLDAVLLHLVERDVLREVAHDAVDPHTRESAPACRDEELLMLALAVAHQRPEDEDARPFGERLDLVDDLLHGLRDDRDTMVGTVRHAHTREEQAHVVVDLGHRAHGRPRIPRGTLLIDRDRG